MIIEQVRVYHSERDLLTSSYSDVRDVLLLWTLLPEELDSYIDSMDSFVLKYLCNLSLSTLENFS